MTNYTEPLVTISLKEYNDLLKLKDKEKEEHELVKRVLVPIIQGAAATSIPNFKEPTNMKTSGCMLMLLSAFQFLGRHYGIHIGFKGDPSMAHHIEEHDITVQIGEPFKQKDK